MLTLDDLRRFTVARNFGKPATLKRALQQMRFVQADPIRAPARAQDLILRQRVRNYRAGDLERRYATLEIEEDFFVIYGFVTRSLQALMHPRFDSPTLANGVAESWPLERQQRADLLLEFVRQRGAVHPREVDEHFSHGRVTNNWGGSSNATTHLLDMMHYRGLLRVARREKGIRIYGAPWQDSSLRKDSAHLQPINETERRAQLDALVDAVVSIYAPLPGASLSFYLRRLRYAAPQWQGELMGALQRAKQRLSHTRIAGIDWYWPAAAQVPAVKTQTSGFKSQMKAELMNKESPEVVRLLAPFDPLVHDRGRFELLWGWAYRFEAYTPVRKRKLGYYALPLLWRDRVIGWANLSVKNATLQTEFGYVATPPRERAFKRELAAELERVRAFLGLAS